MSTAQKKAVVLEQGNILCGLGELEETVTDLFEGASAIIPGPCFGVPVAYAPFKDVSWRSLDASVKALAPSIDLFSIDKKDIVFIFCAAKGDIAQLEEYCTAKKPPGAFLPLLSSQAEYAKKFLGINAARAIVISDACASGATGVEVGRDMLLAGRASAAVIFGFDGISRFVATGFHSLNALSPAGAKPFDARRDGLTIGDGAAIALLTYREPYSGDIIVAGAGSSNDANHRTGPSRTGEGLFRAAQAALADAAVQPPDIGGVKCHGTATNYNDAMEAKALFSLFGEEIPPCFSMKGAIGHTSGAGSLLEILVAAECLARRLVPPTARFSSLGVDEKIPVSDSMQHLRGQSLLCLSAGFGGINAAAVLTEAA
ncbi:MAG TPA: beta-ketoacyl synthase N-terminal-like domain-containing protein [Chitinivibrionales bacterium]|nr:beta-ketoacyl synthase N-terminal-like domain-containing protein [Chitinivibrionales bacterium]